METWMPAVITGIVSVVVCLINNHFSANENSKKQIAQIDAHYSEQTAQIQEHYSEQNAQIQEHYQKQTRQIEEMVAHNEQSIAIIETQIENLRKEVEKHNQIVERVFVLEGRAEKFCEISNNIRKDIEGLSKSIDKIEDKL